MTEDVQIDPAVLLPPSTIHEAELMPGPSGVVWFGPAIDFAEAVNRRQGGLDVVICGDDIDVNRRLASKIEAAVGPATRPQAPHRRAGPFALPHFHQVSRNPQGHTFYETDNPTKKARRHP